MLGGDVSEIAAEVQGGKPQVVEKVVYLIGTVHVSEKSARRVEDTIRVVLPDMVCLELDLRRFRAMQEQISGTAPGEGGHFRYSSTELDGPSIGELLTLPGVLKWMQQEIGKEFGVMPGAEMASAFETTKKYNLNIGLIDRPVETTIARMWGSMKFGEKVKLFSYVAGAAGLLLLRPLFKGHGGKVVGVFGENKELDMNKLEKGEGVDELMGLLKQKFPSLHKTLVEERNIYMCNNIVHILKHGANTLVVVVGMGHVSGMKALLEKKGVVVKVV